MRAPGFRRVFADGTQLGYHAATEIRRSPAVVPQGGSGDFHLRRDRATLVKQSRAFDRDNALFQGLHRATMDNILGSGFSLQAKTGNKRVNATLEKLWREGFCEAPEIRGMYKWHKVEELVLAGVMVAGDIGAVKLASADPEIDGRLELIEAERIDAGRTQTEKPNRLEDGVEVDRYGRPVRFYVKAFDSKRASTMPASCGWPKASSLSFLMVDTSSGASSRIEIIGALFRRTVCASAARPTPTVTCRRSLITIRHRVRSFAGRARCMRWLAVVRGGP